MLFSTDATTFSRWGPCVHTLTLHQWHTREEYMFPRFPLPPLPHTHTPFLSPRYTALQTFMVDLFMRWGSILALGLSLRWGSYCLFLLTAFVVFINITFWHSDIHALPEDRGKNKKSFLIPPNLPSTLSQLWQEDSDCFCWNGGRFEISCCSASLRGHLSSLLLLLFFINVCPECMNQS